MLYNHIKTICFLFIKLSRFQTSCFKDHFSPSVQLSIHSAPCVIFNMSLSSWLVFSEQFLYQKYLRDTLVLFLNESSHAFFFFFWRFLNAAGYFDAIADALEGAEEEIFITAWWYRLDSASIIPLVPSFDDAVSTYFTPLDVVEEYAGLTLAHSSMCTCFLKLNHIPPGDIWYEHFWQCVNASFLGRNSKIINRTKPYKTDTGLKYTVKFVKIWIYYSCNPWVTKAQ